MKSKIALGLAALTAVGFAATAVAPAAEAHGHVCSIIKKYDRRGDGKLNIFEVKRAGKATFKALNPDGDFTLEYDEVRGRIGPKTFAKYNVIRGKGLDRIEWTRLVKARFYAANPDGDRTIECDELKTRAGRRLLAVIWY
ncbi:MAG: calcium-binding protein [Alphaproteobacteria bacterium]|nr:calcium-binding protein [Alphaproteobacteria bacterium]